MMSMFLPGLGQMANGEQRKGALFMVVGVINYITLAALIMAPAIVAWILAFGRNTACGPTVI